MIGGDRIFQLGDDGVLRAINKHTGHVVLDAQPRRACRPPRRRSSGKTRLRDACSRAAAAAKRARRARSTPPTARSRWSRDLPSASESSPLVDHGKLFFGSQNGTVYALNAQQRQRDLDLPRRRRGQGEPDAVAAASSTSATTPATCRRSASAPGGACGSAAPKARCSAAAPSTRPPPSSTGASSSATPTGASTPTTPSTGKLDWAVQTGAYVYASPAVTNAPGPRPDDLPRLLRRHLLRAERPLGPHRLEVRRARQDLRLGDDRRAHRLLRRPRHAPHLRPRHLHRHASSSRWTPAPSTP